MYRFKSYLNTACIIIRTYTGREPLSNFLKNFFSREKKYGSKDRKQIASLCFNFYRLGKAASDLPLEEKMIIATFLCEHKSNEWLRFFKPHWDALIHEPLARKISITKIKFKSIDIFPFIDELSKGIDSALFCESFLIQPDVFLRIRASRHTTLLNKINKSKLPYTLLNSECMAMPNGTKVEDVLDIDKDVVIQDYSSQQVYNYLKDEQVLKSLAHLAHFDVTRNEQVLNAWDCCAASGGKSILLFDILKRRLNITVSDIRLNILVNLHKRFRKAGIKKYNYFLSDLCNNEIPAASPKYDIILCDVPCTGSGTWSRTPEQLYFFTKELIAEYSDKQKKIVSHTIPFLQKDGLFIYSTCSVFQEENEKVAAFIQAEQHLQLMHMELIKGYDKKADSMFVAVFRK